MAKTFRNWRAKIALTMKIKSQFPNGKNVPRRNAGDPLLSSFTECLYCDMDLLIYETGSSFVKPKNCISFIYRCTHVNAGK